MAHDQTASKDAEHLLVQTSAGPVRGIRDGQVSAFHAVPYAAAPVGALRFAAPQDPLPWTDVRDCTQPGPSQAVVVISVWRIVNEGGTKARLMTTCVGNQFSARHIHEMCLFMSVRTYTSSRVSCHPMAKRERAAAEHAHGQRQCSQLVAS